MVSNSASISSRDLVEALLVHQDLDARLVLVVAPPLQVVDAQDRLGIGEEIRLGQEVAHLLADHGRAALAAADEDAKADRGRPSRFSSKADIVHLDGGAVLGAPVTASLNLRGRKENSGCSVDHCRRISA